MSHISHTEHSRQQQQQRANKTVNVFPQLAAPDRPSLPQLFSQICLPTKYQQLTRNTARKIWEGIYKVNKS